MILLCMDCGGPISSCRCNLRDIDVIRAVQARGEAATGPAGVGMVQATRRLADIIRTFLLGHAGFLPSTRAVWREAVEAAEALIAGGSMGTDAENDETGLLPCPFCGGPASIVTPEHDEDACAVECEQCGAGTALAYSLKDDAAADVREKWNRRATRPATPEGR